MYQHRFNAIIMCFIFCVVWFPIHAEEDRFSWASAFLNDVQGKELRIAVDAYQLHNNGLLYSRMRFKPQSKAMRFPKWVPGIHAPAGAIENIGGLFVYDQSGKQLRWQRDSEIPTRFLLPIKQQQNPLILDLTYIANQASVNSTGVDVHKTKGHFICNWNNTLLYHEGVNAEEQLVSVCMRLPDSWGWACALEQAPASQKQKNNVVYFKQCTLSRLVDSPLIAGNELWQETISKSPTVRLHIAGSIKENVNIHEHWLNGLRQLPAEAHACFGGAHYDTYDILLISSDDKDAYNGLEHKRSSLNVLSSYVLLNPGKAASYDSGLIPHEYVHSWCGKYRRPAGMWTENFHKIKKLDGLWIYEGLTQYYGSVLAVRCGLVKPESWRMDRAEVMVEHATQTGRAWRSLRDCCRSSYLLRGWSEHHHDLRRGQDYYTEGALFWLAADLKIRHLSKDTKSLDDVCKQFFGPQQKPGPFTEAELIEALNAVAAFDWKAEIDEKIDSVSPVLDLDFLTLSGWRLSEKPLQINPEEQLSKFRNLHTRVSLGLSIHGGWITEVLAESVADKAGLIEGDYVHAVNGVAFEDDPKTLAKAIIESPTNKAINLYIYRDEEWKSVNILYAEGLKIHNLERDESSRDRLADILKSQRKK